MSDLLANLNPQQLRAVTLPPQPALILAGAGSGKTRVLTTRIAWLIASGLATPHNVLAVTFTNKAAREMQTRLASLLPINLRGMWIGTFHGLCNRLLRAHHRDAGLPALFQILDSGDQQAAVKRLLKGLNIDDQQFPPREFCHYINAHKEAGRRASQVEAWDAHTRQKAELYAAYEAQCQREGVVDFAELLLRCHELLLRNEPLRRHYQTRFAHLLVDEFQDTNPLQYQWLKLLAGHGNPDTAGAQLFAVGDDDQSIYAFRGADVGNMRAFQHEFGISEVIRLEQNYRSHGQILDAANAIIKNNRDRLGKTLWTEAGAGEPLRLYEAESDLDEARYIVEEIRELSNEGHARRQIALLYRSNAQSRVLEHQLFSAGITYRVYGGQRFFDRQEIKHALAYLRLIANPDDDTAFMRVVNFPVRGIGARSLETLQAHASQVQASLYNAAASLPGRSGAALAGFIRLIEGLRDETHALPLPEMIAAVLDRSSLRQHYQADKEGQERLDNLDELLNAATAFVQESSDGDLAALREAGDLAGFLAHASLESGEHQAGEGDDAVQLMTVHAAKGLEFDAVFITGLEEGLFPHDNAANDPDGMAEERRLMYVAITRARQRLYLSHARTRMLHGQTRYCIPSSFCNEIPAGLIRRINSTPRPQGGWMQNNQAATTKGYPPRVSPPAATRTPVSPQASAGGLRLGQQVAHARFGEGTIIACEGLGSSAQVTVRFATAGEKRLSLEYAKLTPIS